MDAQDYLALLNNMAGNAWSCFQFAPLHMAMVSTIGHFIKSADDQCPATGEARETQAIAGPVTETESEVEYTVSDSSSVYSLSD